MGVDIGTRTVTLAEVRLAKGRPTITNFGGTELPPDAVREGEILDGAAVAKALQHLLERTDVKARKVWLGVANQRVVVRQLDLPWMEEQERAQSLRFQAAEHLPIPIDDAELDSHIIEEVVAEDGTRTLRTLLVAAHRDMVAAHVDVAEQAGLRPLGVDLTPFAVLRAVGTTSDLDDQLEAVVDVGAGVTSIVVHHAGTPAFVRILVTGGDVITKALAETGEMSVDDAEMTKRQLTARPGSEHGSGLQRTLADRTQALVDEIRTSLDFHQTQTGAGRVGSVVLTGGGSLLAGLPERLADELHLPVELGSVFDRVEVTNTDRTPEELARFGPSLAAAVGLALGGLE